MATSSIAPQFIVDELGRRTKVVLSVKDFKRLLAAWEDVADARDFDKAKRTARSFMSVAELEGAASRRRRK